jgi:hypothetical protein
VVSPDNSIDIHGRAVSSEVRAIPSGGAVFFLIFCFLIFAYVVESLNDYKLNPSQHRVASRISSTSRKTDVRTKSRRKQQADACCERCADAFIRKCSIMCKTVPNNSSLSRSLPLSLSLSLALDPPL